jgi:hypothetical protein
VSQPAAAEYPHRRPLVFPGGPWVVVFVDEPGEPDANTICQMQDAVEARRSILIAARCAVGLEAALHALLPMIEQAPAPTLH